MLVDNASPEPQEPYLERIAALGVRLPITESEEKYRIEAYLLWDFGDGPFWKGW